MVTMLAIVSFSCTRQKNDDLPGQTVAVARGDLILSVSADGNLDMPNEVKLKFGTSGTVREIRVNKGDIVKAGTLLAKLDNTTQILAIEAAQYSLEQAINSVIQTSCSPRYPTFYSLATGIMRFEQSQEEINQARECLTEKNYLGAASNLSLAMYDLQATRSVYANPKLDTFQTQYNELNQPVPRFPELIEVVSVIDKVIERLSVIQTEIEAADYAAVLGGLNSISTTLHETHGVVDRNSRLPETYTYPDTSTSLAVSRQVQDNLADLQDMLYQNGFDRIKFYEKLRMAQHDLSMSNMILDENETYYRAGLNPQTLRNYNINIEIAMINLEKAKQELLKTEILAPFDGTVVDIDLKENDQLSPFDYASKTAVHLVDTKTIRVTGAVDEIDITKVKVGQESIITADALPDKKLKGTLTFVSPFGILQSGVINFPFEIYLDNNESEDLRGGLTATADIIVGKRENVLMVPNRAIKGLAGDFWVHVVTDPTTVTTEKRLVKIGFQTEDFAEIISGLEEGEKILSEATE